jgi:hypothetical protein
MVKPILPQSRRKKTQKQLSQSEQDRRAEQSLIDFRLLGLQLLVELLGPWWTLTPQTTLDDAQEAFEELLRNRVRDGKGKSARQLTDEFIRAHYPETLSVHTRNYLTNLFQQELAKVN